MGWYTHHAPGKQALIQMLTETTVNIALNVQRTRTCLAHCYRGNSFSGVLWSVHELTYERLLGSPAGTPVPPPYRWICCDIMQFRREAKDANWWYKPLTEIDEPVVTSCPPSYLDMVPLGDSTSEAWRERVKSTAAEIAAKSQATKARRKAARDRELATNY